MIAPARIAAYEILNAVSRGQADLPSAIASARQRLADERDRALASEIATGVQRSRNALDYLIVQLSKRSLDRLDPQVVEILRLSLYQLLHLTRVPASAVVDDAVELVRRAGKKSAAGFANAVLRTATRTPGTLPPRPETPADRDAALDYLSITLSHPRWLAARWHDRLGFATAERWMQFNNRPAPLTLRANTVRLTRDELSRSLSAAGVNTKSGPFAPDALIVESGHPAGDGFLIQDEASQLVALLAGTSPGRRVLDACASPGGKATAIAAAMPDASLLVACDVRPRRVDLLRRTVRAAGATNIALVQADLGQPLPFDPVFHCVVVDAPCSGLGTLRRDPDLRWRRQESDIQPLAEAELRMLTSAADVVAQEGRLVYATCSSEPEENEWLVDRFLAARPDFVAVSARGVHPSLPDTVVDGRGHLRTTPDQHELEAFFGAVFQRSA